MGNNIKRDFGKTGRTDKLYWTDEFNLQRWHGDGLWDF